MDTKLYVGNLSYSATEDDLLALFSEVGNVVSVTLIKDRESGQNKGFGFIEMSNQVDAETAINRFNGYRMGGRELKVNIARPREPREQGRRGGGRDQRGQRGRRDQRDRRY